MSGNPPTAKMAAVTISSEAAGPKVKSIQSVPATAALRDLAKSTRKSFARRDHLLDIQKRVQKKWQEENTFQADPVKGKKKFLATFPYPYMNGRLHLGHAFTMTKADFAVG